VLSTSTANVPSGFPVRLSAIVRRTSRSEDASDRSTAIGASSGSDQAISTLGGAGGNEGGATTIDPARLALTACARS
jgi:hypothetical protein